MENRLRLAIYCSCGDKLVGSVASVELADAIMQLFARHHVGAGHAPVNPKLNANLKSPSRRRRPA